MNMKYVKPLALIGFFFIISAVFSSSAFAASCKGLSKTACSNNSSCSYTKSYTTKNGTKVSAYCRNKPGKKSATKNTKDTSKKIDKKSNNTKKSTTSKTKDSKKSSQKESKKLKEKN